MGRKKERPSTRPVDWEKLTKASTSKKDDRPATLAPGYAGPNPSEFPVIGGKEGPAVVDHLPFPLCIGLAPDLHSNNQAKFNAPFASVFSLRYTNSSLIRGCTGYGPDPLPD